MDIWIEYGRCERIVKKVLAVPFKTIDSGTYVIFDKYTTIDPDIGPAIFYFLSNNGRIRSINFGDGSYTEFIKNYAPIDVLLEKEIIPIKYNPIWSNDEFNFNEENFELVLDI